MDGGLLHPSVRFGASSLHLAAQHIPQNLGAGVEEFEGLSMGLSAHLGCVVSV